MCSCTTIVSTTMGFKILSCRVHGDWQRVYELHVLISWAQWLNSSPNLAHVRRPARAVVRRHMQALKKPSLWVFIRPCAKPRNRHMVLSRGRCHCASSSLFVLAVFFVCCNSPSFCTTMAFGREASRTRGGLRSERGQRGKRGGNRKLGKHGKRGKRGGFEPRDLVVADRSRSRVPVTNVDEEIPL